MPERNIFDAFVSLNVLLGHLDSLIKSMKLEEKKKSYSVRTHKHTHNKRNKINCMVSRERNRSKQQEGKQLRSFFGLIELCQNYRKDIDVTRL